MKMDTLREARALKVKSSALKGSTETSKSSKDPSHPVPLIAQVVEEQAKSIRQEELPFITCNSTPSKSLASLLTPSRRRSVRISERLQNKSHGILESDTSAIKATKRENMSSKILDADQRPTENLDLKLFDSNNVPEPSNDKTSGNMQIKNETMNIIIDKSARKTDSKEDLTKTPPSIQNENKSVSYSEEILCVKAKEFTGSGVKLNDYEQDGLTLPLTEIETKINIDEKVEASSEHLSKKNSSSFQFNKPNIKKDEHLSTMLLGRKKSGRFWKGERDRFRSVVQSKGLKQHLSAQKRLAQKEQYRKVKEYERSLKEDAKRIKEEKNRRREENKKRKLENEKKNEIVQIIKNPAKIKRMKKKQLRMLAKRDMVVVQ